MGNSLYDLGDLPGAKKSYEEVRAIYREIGNRRGSAGALDNIANVLGDQGDFATATRLSEESLAIYREIGDKNGAAQTLNNMGTVQLVQGNFRAARAFFEQALPVYRETGDSGGLSICLNNVAEMEAGQGDVAARAPTSRNPSRSFATPDRRASPSIRSSASRARSSRPATSRARGRCSRRACRSARSPAIGTSRPTRSRTWRRSRWPKTGWPTRAKGKADNPRPLLRRKTASLLPAEVSATNATSPRRFKDHGSKSLVKAPPPGADSPSAAIFSIRRWSHRAETGGREMPPRTAGEPSHRRNPATSATTNSAASTTPDR
jgi:hypothetical protein